MIKLIPDRSGRSAPDQSDGPTPGDHARPVRRTRWIGASAAVGLGAVWAGAWMVGSVSRHAASRHADTQRPPDAMHRVTAPAGRRASLSLPDGSQVTLGPGSTLSYPKEFRRRREVRLDGEAYFQVAPASRQPFVVRLDRLLTKGFGAPDTAAGPGPFVRAGDLTRQGLRSDFVVRAYPEDPYPRVAVRAGQVALADRLLSAGELGWLSDSGLPVVEPADTASWFAWTEGKLVFTSAFRDVLPRLSRWYNVNLRLADSASGNAVLVAALPDSLPPNGLEVVALALGLRIERRGRMITFYPDVTRRPRRPR